MNLKELTAKALKKRGFDGLYNADGQCGCLADDLFPCSCPSAYCCAGYRVPCDGTCDDGKCDFHIVPTNRQ